MTLGNTVSLKTFGEEDDDDDDEYEEDDDEYEEEEEEEEEDDDESPSLSIHPGLPVYGFVFPFVE
jgi:hypothetical protein